MKLINFSANIAKNSNKLICQSDKNFLTIDEGFSIRIEDDHYVIRDVEKEEVLFDFKQIKIDDQPNLLVKNLEQNQFYPKDFVEIYAKEYEINSKAMITEGGQGYEEGQVIPHEEYGGKCNIRIDKVEGGKVTSVHIESLESFFAKDYREIKPDSDFGEGLEILVEFIDSKKVTSVEKNIKSSTFSRGNNYINLEYPIPSFIEEGKIKIYRSILTLDKQNLKEFGGQTVCIAQKVDFTPIMKIPIVERGTINAFKIYNEGATIIEDKFMELEKRIIDLESRL